MPNPFLNPDGSIKADMPTGNPYLNPDGSIKTDKPDKVYSGSDTQMGRDYYSDEVVKARQKPFAGKQVQLLPTVENIGNALPGGEEAIPSYATAAAIGLPEISPWLLPLIGAGVQGGTRYGLNKLEDKPGSQDVLNETAKGAIGGGLGLAGSYLGKLAGAIASKIGENPATKELAAGLAARTKTPALNVGPFRFGGQPIVKEVGPEVSGVIKETLDKAATTKIPSMQDVVNARVSLEDAPEALQAAMARRQNTIDAIAKLKGTSPEKFVEADLLPSQTMDISKDITQPLSDLQRSALSLGEKSNLFKTIGMGGGRIGGLGLADYLSQGLGETKIMKDANAKIDATYR
jgi:hypothetical protein